MWHILEHVCIKKTDTWPAWFALSSVIYGENILNFHLRWSQCHESAHPHIAHHQRAAERTRQRPHIFHCSSWCTIEPNVEKFLAVAQWRLYVCARIIIARRRVEYLPCLLAAWPIFIALDFINSVIFSISAQALSKYDEVWRNASKHRRKSQLHQWDAAAERKHAEREALSVSITQNTHVMNPRTSRPWWQKSLCSPCFYLCLGWKYVLISAINLGVMGARLIKSRICPRGGGDRAAKTKEIKASVDFLKCGSAQKRAFETMIKTVNSRAPTNKWWAFLWVFRPWFMWDGRNLFKWECEYVCWERKIHTQGLCLFLWQFVRAELDKLHYFISTSLSLLAKIWIRHLSNNKHRAEIAFAISLH